MIWQPFVWTSWLAQGGTSYWYLFRCRVASLTPLQRGRGGVQLPPGNGSATDNGLGADCGASVTHAARAPMELLVKARNATFGTLYSITWYLLLHINGDDCSILGFTRLFDCWTVSCTTWLLLSRIALGTSMTALRGSRVEENLISSQHARVVQCLMMPYGGVSSKTE